MRIPHTIPKNVSEAYRCSRQTILLPREQTRSIRAEDSTWDESVIPELRILALRVIVQRWKEAPILQELPTCMDRNVLLEILPVDLPFDLIVERIHDDYYWSRAARHRWEYNNPEDHGNSWQRLYCEKHFADYLENLDPRYFESQPDECENLVNLVRNHVQTLRIRSLVPSRFLVKLVEQGEEEAEEGDEGEEEKNDDETKVELREAMSEKVEDPCSATEDSTVHHIPLSVILSKLTEVRELCLNFDMIHENDGFEWRDFRFSIDDCLGLGRAVKNSPKLNKISITRSDLDQPRIAALLQGIIFNNNIQDIEFSHCKLGNSGAHAIGEFLKTHKGLQILHLVNNRIEADGLAGIVHGLLQETGTSLKLLDLRLNPLRGDGGTHICAFLLRNSSLEKLNISGCGLGPETGVAIAEVLSSGYTKFSYMEIDLSNNDLGPIAGEALDVAMKTSSTIVGLDVRMCNVLKESESSINESILRNVEDRKKQELLAIQRKNTISNEIEVENWMQPPVIESLSKPENESNIRTNGSLRSVQMQQRLLAGVAGLTKSILKVGSRRIKPEVVGDNTLKLSPDEFSMASIR